MSPSERYFAPFRAHIIGHDRLIETPGGLRPLVYADWTASGRAYRPIETWLQEEILPFWANTHTETTLTGTRMSAAYEEARAIVKAHVRAGDEDALLFCGSGMTGAVNKLQRLLGLKGATPAVRPVVFVTDMEHHSNHLSWLETTAEVAVFSDVSALRALVARYADRPLKIAAVTACSNVTGILTPVDEIASLMHSFGGFCFVDYACAAPYVDIDMRPLDAIYFSGHKFLGGPGTPGVLVFKRRLYRGGAPDQPGGGTVLYANPWGDRDYVEDIEQREDGGTPPLLGAIKLGQCIRLKEAMGVERIRAREQGLVTRLLDGLSCIDRVRVLAADHRVRLGVVSFIVEGAHYDDVVRFLNDQYGIQSRGGCSCAGPYGHKLLGIDFERSVAIRAGLSSKPGWVRISIHPTTTDAEIDYILGALAHHASFSAGFTPLVEPIRTTGR